MATQQTIGLRGLLKPEVDKRSSRTAKKDIEEDLSEVEEIQPDVDTSAMQDTLDDFDMGGAMGGVEAPEGSGGVGGAAGAVGGASAGGRRRGGGGGAGAAAGGLAGAASGGLAKIALGGAVAVGMLGSLNTIKNLTMASSPALQATAGMFGTAMELFFRPFGNFLSDLLRPMGENLLEMAKNFNQNVSENGLTVAVAEGLSGVDITDGGLGEKILGGLGAVGGGAGGAWLGASKGAAVGGTVGSVVPGVGTAAGGTAGAVIGGTAGALGGTAIGGRVGGGLGEKLDNFEWPEMPSMPDASGFVDDLQQGTEGAAESIMSSGSEFADNVQGISVNDVVTGTIDLGQWMWSGTIGLGQWLWSGTIGLGQWLWSGTIGLGQWLWSGTISLGQWLWSGTIGLGQWLWSGTINWGQWMFSGAINWGQWMFEGALSWGSWMIDGSIDIGEWVAGKINIGQYLSGGGGGGGSSSSSSGSSGGDRTLDPRTWMADGGIVTSRTDAVIGEQGPEAVMPLSDLHQSLETAARAGASLSVSNSRSDGQDMSEVVGRLDDVIAALEALDMNVTTEITRRDVSEAAREGDEKFGSTRVVR